MNKPTKSGQRRSGRLRRQLPIQVTGIDAMGRNFTDPAHTLVLSRHGAEILLKKDLVPEQEISISLPGSSQDGDARVVGLFSTRPEGLAYGIEFLLQEGNFWGVAFPAGPASSESRGENDNPTRVESAKPTQIPTKESESKANSKKVKIATSKNYAIRLKCLHHQASTADNRWEGGDEDQWLILQDRQETLQQVLETSWDFTCPLHGAQREYPLEAKQVHSDVKIRFAEPFSKALTTKYGNQGTEKSKHKSRREHRWQKSLRVWVLGLDLNGNQFLQSSRTIDISRNGARLDGIGWLTLPGTTIEVRHHWRKALFRVVWAGMHGTPQANQIGIVCLQPGANFWNIA